MFRILLIISAIALITATGTDCFGVNSEPDVIPALRQWTGGEGQVDVSNAKIIIDKKSAKSLKEVSAIFAADAAEALKLDKPLRVKTGGKVGKGDILLTLAPKGNSIAVEGYTIDINDSVTVKASTPAGIYWATRTLTQMLSQDATLPQGSIVDWPDYPIRSVLVDVGRKFIPFEELKDWVIALSYFKMNEIHLHLNDNCWNEYGAYRVEMKTIPGLTATDGHYTQKQIRELQNFAKVRGVTITPEIDSPGHSRAFTIVRPDLAHPRLGANYLDITNPETYTFMEKVFDEIVPLFDAPHFHIGTDEYRLGAIGDKAERQMLGEKFRQYINYFNDYIRKKGKTVRIWSGYEHMPGTTEPDKSIVIDMWETSDAKNKSKAGYEVINSTHLWTYIVPGAPYYGVSNTFLYNDWTALKFSNKPAGQLTREDPGLLGGKLHVWNDNGTTGYTTNEIARLSMPTVMVFGEKLWGVKGSDNYAAFAERAERILGTSGAIEMVPGSHAAHSSKNPQTAEIPGTSFLKRKAAGTDKLVWELDEADKNIIPNTTVELDIEGGVQNLEYPWTATFELTRLTDVPNIWEIKGSGGEILLSSDIATLYLDYLHIAKNNKTKEVTEKRGVALVRANHAPARRPIDTKAADIVMFDYQVPRYKKVTLTFVGYMNRTELYVDGKQVGSSNKQTVCPLKRLGDTYPNGFHGVLHSAAIYNTAPEQAVVGGWKSEQMSEDWKPLQWDITPHIKTAGSCAATFQYTGGACRLDVQWAALLENGKEIARDTHPGQTGGSNSQNTYTFDLKTVKPNATYTLKASVRSDGGTDSNGDVLLFVNK